MRAQNQLTFSLRVMFICVMCAILFVTGCSRFSLSKQTSTADSAKMPDSPSDIQSTEATTPQEDDLNARIQAHADELLAAIERQQAQQKAKSQAQLQPSRQSAPSHDPAVDRLAQALDQHAQIASSRVSDAQMSDPLPQVKWLDLTPAPSPTPQPVSRVDKVPTIAPKPVPTHVAATAKVPIVQVASTPIVSASDTATLTHQLADNIRLSEQTPLQKALALSSLSLSCNQNLLTQEDIKELNAVQMQQLRKMHSLVLQTLAKQTSNGTEAKDHQSAMNDQITKLFGPDATRIGKVEFCRTVSGYGVYEPFESTTFMAGIEQPLILYVELENFNSLYDGQQYRVRLSQQVALYTDADGVRVWHLPQEEIIDVSRNKRRDFFTVQLLHLPARLGVGKYRLKVRIHDINASSYDEITMPITLVASQGTTARKDDDNQPRNVRDN